MPDDELGQQPEADDPWSQAAGHVGAPAAPSWGQPAQAPTPDVDWASQGTPPPPPMPAAPNTAEPAPPIAAPPPPPPGAHHPNHHQPHRQADPYGVAAYSNNDAGYARDTGGRSRYANGRYRPGRYRKTGAASRNPTALAVPLFVLSLATFGILAVISAIVAIVQAVRARRVTGSYRVGPARYWLIWLVVYVVVAAGGITLLSVGDSGSSSSDSSSYDHVNYPTSTVVSAALGQSRTVQAQVSTDTTSSKFIPVTVAVLAYHHPVTIAGVSDINTTIDIKVCATTTAVDPDLAAAGIELVSSTGKSIDRSDDGPTSEAFFNPQAPGGCITDTQGYLVPAGTTVSHVLFGDVQQITWPVR